jgi:hypothetical protein
MTAHPPGQETTRIGGGELAAALIRYLASHPDLGGLGRVMRVEHWWFTARLRLRFILRRTRVAQELDEELQFHLERKIEEGIAHGLSPKKAR